MKKSLKDVRERLVKELEPRGIEFYHDWIPDGVGGEWLRSYLGLESHKRISHLARKGLNKDELDELKSRRERENEYDWLGVILSAGGISDTSNRPTVSMPSIECPDREDEDA